MKIVNVTSLAIPEVKVIEFERFKDNRGYFTETFNAADFGGLDFLADRGFFQQNESFSKANVVRGLHFQWGPPMGKLVRTIFGHMVDMVMDVRKNSPNFGKIILFDMPASFDDALGKWIWVPPGFAHGNFFLTDTIIQYFCTEAYKPGSEGGISPFASDINWTLTQPELKQLFDNTAKTAVISEKDKGNINLTSWAESELSQNFLYAQ